MERRNRRPAARVAPWVALIAAAVALPLAGPAYAGTPFVQVLEDQGRIGCAVVVQTSTINPGSAQVPNLPPCGENDRELEVEPVPNESITGAVFELEWVATSEFAEVLSMVYHVVSPAAQVNFCTDAAHNPDWKRITGTSPLRIALEGGATSLYLLNPGHMLHFRVDPQHAAAQHETPPVAGVVLGQEFQLTATLFFNGADVPGC